MLFKLWTPGIWHLVQGIGALLVVSTLVVTVLQKWKPQWNLREVALRIYAWWIMAFVFVLAVGAPLWAALTFVCFVSFVALREYISLIPTRKADRFALLMAFIAVPLQYFWVWRQWYGMFIIFIPVHAFLFIHLKMVLEGETKGFLQAASSIQWGLMITVFSLSHMAYFMVLPQNEPMVGRSLLLFLVFLTQINDVAQFCFGKAFGKSPILPKVSPKKTVEGFLGGVLTTVSLAYFLAPGLTPFQPLQAIAAGLIISVGGFFGDVTMSAVKRDLGIKDASNLIPGHGGILDRIDSLTYTAPFLFHFTRYLYF